MVKVINVARLTGSEVLLSVIEDGPVVSPDQFLLHPGESAFGVVFEDWIDGAPKTVEVEVDE